MKIEKRNEIIMIMSILLVSMLVSCNFTNQEVIISKPHNYIQEGTENNMKSSANFVENYQAKSGDITVYNLSYKAFKDFLLNPSADNLSAQCDTLSIYRNHLDKYEYIQQDIYTQEGHVSDQ